MTAVADLAMVPARVLAALGLHTYGLTPEQVRERLAALGELDPERAHSIADELAVCALRLIRDGHPRAVELARDTLTVLDAEPPRVATRPCWQVGADLRASDTDLPAVLRHYYATNHDGFSPCVVTPLRTGGAA